VKLKSLHLKIDYNNYIGNSSIQEIGKSLANLKELEKLYILIGANNTSPKEEGDIEENRILCIDTIIPMDMKNLREFELYIGA